MMMLEEWLRTFYLFSSKCGSGFCAVVSLYVNSTKPSGTVIGI